VLYVAFGARLDFWWLKPRGAALDERTLHRHASGDAKNDPAASRAVYEPLAKLFMSDGPEVVKAGGGRLSFGVARAEDGKPRAFIEQRDSGERYYLCLIWQENFTTNPLARSKLLSGKLVYQLAPRATVFHARPFVLRDGVLSVSTDAPEEKFSSALPPDTIKLGCVAR